MASTYLQPLSKRRRATAIVLTVVIHVLIVLVFLNLAYDRPPRPSSNALSTFDVAPEAGKQPQPVPKLQPEQQRKRVARAAPPRPNPPPDVTPIPEYLRMTRDQFAATDLSRLPRSTDPRESRASAADVKSEPDNSANDNAPAYAAGAGPGGARLYVPEWQRRPTNAELANYLPQVPVGSWAIVACRAIADNRVENCQFIGESPIGSKLATGVRRAAWQFRVRPWRVSGKPIIGEWIRIKITIVEGGFEAG